MRLSELAYELPAHLVAQEPLSRREDSRLLVVDRKDGRLSHRRFAELPSLLDPSDLLVVNDTRVVPAKLRGVREATGAKVEVLLLRPVAPGSYESLAKPGKRIREGEWLSFGDLRARVAAASDKKRILTFAGNDLARRLDEIGEAPLPPYIRRPPVAMDRNRYQTIYAASPGAVAAPTAGLHFSEEILRELRGRGVEIATLTLHVGWGTFAPVTVDNTQDHRVEPERMRVPATTLRAIAAALSRGRRIVAVGTTAVRTLESLTSDEIARGEDVSRETSLVIAPPASFSRVGALLTNFHLPCSSLLMLVAAFTGTARVLAAYRTAITEGYRFYSYGDAMLAV